MRIFTDLDGVVLDTSERSYRVYEGILRAHRFLPLEKKPFLELKRQRTSPMDILARTEARNISETFEKEWGERIETAASLQYDRLLPSAAETLRKMTSHAPLYLVTLRKKPELLMDQLVRFDIKKFFTDILIGDEEEIRHEGKIQKMRALARPGDVMIGDSETDIRAGKSLGMITVAVESGWRSEELLSKESPDYLISSIASFLALPLFTRS